MKKTIFSLALAMMTCSAFAQTPEEKAAAKAAAKAQKEAVKAAETKMNEGLKLYTAAKADYDGWMAFKGQNAKNPEKVQAKYDEMLPGMLQKCKDGDKLLEEALGTGLIVEKKQFPAWQARDFMVSQNINEVLSHAQKNEPFDTTYFSKLAQDISEACHGQITTGNPKDDVQKNTIIAVSAKFPKVYVYHAYATMFEIQRHNLEGAMAAYDNLKNFPTRYPEVANDPAVKNPDVQPAQMAFNIYYTAYTEKKYDIMAKYYDDAVSYDDAESRNFVLQSKSQVLLAKGDTAAWVQNCKDVIKQDPESQAASDNIQNLLFYYSKKDMKQMAAFADEILQMAPNSRTANYGKGIALFNQEPRDLKGALSYFEKALQIDGNYADAMFMAGTCSANLGRAELEKINDKNDKGGYAVKTKVKVSANMTEAQERAMNAAAKKANAEAKAAYDADVAKYVAPFYKKAATLFENYRMMKEDEPGKWAYELRDCYRILQNKEKLAEMEQIIKEQRL